MDQAGQSEVVEPEFTREIGRHEPTSKERRRHIFVFFDGTWNEERTPHGPQVAPTNVLRMYQEINRRTVRELDSLEADTERQEIVAHYYRGVGNRQDNTTANRLWYGFNGKDEERIRRAAFADVFRAYRGAQDRIYILGFSRGAASARLLANDICAGGLPRTLEVRTRHFANMVTGQIEARTQHVVERGRSKSIPNPVYPKVAFLGCWDTVGAFVLPSRFPRKKFIDKAAHLLKSSVPRVFGKEGFRKDEYKVPSAVEKAIHCVAIDETRNAFLPTLMPDAENVEEVWFPGVHSDIGGGYEDNMLSKGPYDFMKQRLVEATGLLDTDLFNSDEAEKSGYCFHFHGLDSGMKRLRALFGFGRAMRAIRVLEPDSKPHDGAKTRPKIHESIFSVMNSDAVFAADKSNKRTWTITYDPYNVHELGQDYEVVRNHRE